MRDISTSSRVLKSSFSLLAIQVVQRSLGIISTLILARLLTPEHFGIVALVTIALQFFELLAETGNQQYIIQKEHVEDDDLNTAWSMDIAIKAGMAIVVILCAPLLANFFETAELTAALSIAALAMPIRALKTPGMMLLAREINYHPVFWLTLWQKAASFITVVTIALMHPSHWAIIIGTLVSAVIMAIGSYKVHSYRPTWTLKHLRKQWQFSQWLLARGIVGFTRSQVDNLMVSKIFGPNQLGGYNLVREVSLLPALTAIIPMTEPLLAAIAENKHNPQAFAYRVRLSFALLISVLVPLTTFMMLYPKLIITVLLGPQWEAYTSLLQPFGLFFFTFCLFSLISDTVIAQGRVKALFVFDTTSTAVIILSLLLIGTGTMETMAWTRGWLAIITTLLLLFSLNHWISLGLPRLAILCLPAVIGSGVAACSISFLHMGKVDPIIQLFIKGSAFLVISIFFLLAASLLLLKNSDEWHHMSWIIKSSLSNLKNNEKL